MSKNIVEIGHISTNACGKYRVGIVDAKTNQVVYMSDWKPNLILNSGLSMVATMPWISCASYCYAGTGSTSGNGANSTDSGSQTASSDASGNVTLSGAGIDLTSQASNGDCLLWDGGEQGRITSIGGASSCTITPAPGGSGIAANTFTLLRTSRSSLISCVKKVNTYLPNRPNQESVRIGNVLVNRQTYDFIAETTTVNYTEIGFSGISVTPPSSPSLFSRLVLDTPLTLTAGQYLRVVYQLQITILPITSQSLNPTITGWTGTTGTYWPTQVGLATWLIGATSPGNGVSGFSGGAYVNEPSQIGTGSYIHWVSHTKTGMPGWSWPGQQPSRAYVLPTLENTVYSNDFTGLTYTQVKSSSWKIGEANQETIDSINSIGFGYFSSVLFGESDPTANSGYIFEFDNPQYKFNTQVLTLRTKYSWSRSLTIN